MQRLLRSAVAFLVVAGFAGQGLVQVVITSDGGANLRLGFLLQGWADSLQDPVSRGYSQNFFVRRVRLIAAGSVTADASFFFETENSRLGDAGTSGAKNITTGLHVLDAFGEWRVFGNDRFILDVGKMVIPLTRNSLQSISTPLALDAGTFTFLQGAGTQSDAGRDLGIQIKSYFAGDHLEFRGGVFDGFRAPGGAAGADSRNALRWVGRLVYNFFDTEKGYVPIGTNLGRKKILAVEGGFDTQSSHKAYRGDFMIDWPIGQADAARGQGALTAHVDYIHFDGGCGLTSAGARSPDCLIPTLPDEDELFTDLGFYLVDLNAPALRPFRVERLRGRDRPRQGLAPLHWGASTTTSPSRA